MKSSPKSNEMPPSTGSKTPASGKKMIQARLPFKSLGGSVPPFPSTNDTSDTPPSAATDHRKRKQTDDAQIDDGIRGAKLNRCGNISLETNEIMELSNDVPSENDAENGSKLTKANHTSESKENVCDVKRTADEMDLTDDCIVTDSEEAPIEPKAKQSLDFEKKPSDSRKSKRSESSLITIKLPMPKKSKESTKKQKKHKKTSNDAVQNGSEKEEAEAEEEMNVDEAATTVTGKQHEDKQPEIENTMEVDAPTTSADQEVVEHSKSSGDDEGNVLNDSIVSNPPEKCSTPTNLKLTPKQVQRRLESEQKKREKEQARLERERKLQREKEEKELQKKRERDEKGNNNLLMKIPQSFPNEASEKLMAK